LSKPRFGEEGQLEVVGWSGRQGFSKLYILKCNRCSEDCGLFGEGYFRSNKYNLVRGTIPCGCAFNPKWSKEQHFIRCLRKAKELGYRFLGFEGPWKGNNTKIKIVCEKHGYWDSGTINSLMQCHGCPECKEDTRGENSRKPEKEMIRSFLASGAFHPETKFWRSDRRDSKGSKTYWIMSCPACEGTGESQSGSLQKGQRPCACSTHRQQECYINWLVDNHNMAVAIKFGIANNSKQRIKQQDSKSAYTLKQHSIYQFPSVQQCKQAERECKKELETGVVLKRDMPDGWTETTWSYNIGKVVDIYKRNGGVLV